MVICLQRGANDLLVVLEKRPLNACLSAGARIVKIGH